MRLWLLAVGRPGALLAGPIAEFETRARRYWGLETMEVKEEKARRGMPGEDVRAAESKRLLERVPAGAEAIALTRTGDPWTSLELARHLESLAVQGHAGAAFLIGGALGLDDAVLASVPRRLSLSALTLPHDLARLLLAEQLYRAGTIVRGEPYHKGRR